MEYSIIEDFVTWFIETHNPANASELATAALEYLENGDV